MKNINVFTVFFFLLVLIQNVNAASYTSDGLIVALSINNLKVYDLNFSSKCIVKINGIDFSNQVIPLFESVLTAFTDTLQCYYYLGKDINQIQILINEDGHVTMDKTITVYKNPYEFYNAQLITELFNKPFYPDEFKNIKTTADNKKRMAFFIYFLFIGALLLFKMKSNHVMLAVLFMFILFAYIYSSIGTYDYMITVKGNANTSEFKTSQYMDYFDDDKILVIDTIAENSESIFFSSTSVYIRKGKIKLSAVASSKPIIFNIIPLIKYDMYDYHISFDRFLQWWIAYDKK